jgi:L-threonylcarbamoyladenylate synthase
LPASQADDVARAADALRRGELVAFPTETVYGLGADAANAAAVKRLFAVKRRPRDHPVIVHIARAEQLAELAKDVPGAAHALAAAFWPGPLTLVVPRNPERVVPEITGGRDTVGLRVPDHPLARALLEAFGGGVAAPSANRFGKVSPTSAAHVRDDLGDDVAVVLDGGACRVGIESTLVDVTGPEPALLGGGGVSRARFEASIGRGWVLRATGEVAAPGTLASHYAPAATVELTAANAVARRAREHIGAGKRVGVLALRQSFTGVPDQLVVLDPPGDEDEYARVLYARLRAADEHGLDVLLAVVPPDTDGMGAAVADRLRRAAG